MKTEVKIIITQAVTLIVASLVAVSMTEPASAGPVTTATSTQPTILEVDVSDVDPTNLSFNDDQPMPDKIEGLDSLAAFKARLLRSITHGSISIGGAIATTDGNNKTWTVYGNTPQEILDGLTRHVFRFAMANPNDKLDINASLMEGNDYQGQLRFHTSLQVSPVKKSDCTYEIREPLVLEMLQHQWIKLPGGDSIVSVNISSRDDQGNVTDQQDIHSYNGWSWLPTRFIGKSGNLLIVRKEPTDIGSREVVYNYDTKTSLAQNAYSASAKLGASVQNYTQVSDDGVPLVIDGALVPIIVKMNVSQNISDQGGNVAFQSQPVARVDVSFARVVMVSAGLYDSSYGTFQVIERPAFVTVIDRATDVKRVIYLDPSGSAIVIVPAGSHDFMADLSQLNEPQWWYGGKG